MSPFNYGAVENGIEERAMTQALTVAPQQAIAPLSKDQIDLVKRTVFPKATDDELTLYLHDCARQGVHPLDRLIHPTVRTDKKSGARKYTPIISIDFMRTRAEETGAYAGNDDPVFEGTPKSADFSATVTVWKMVGGQRCPFTAKARWSEYKPPDDFMWQAKPNLMLGKCAEALALRKAFPRVLGKLYIGEEMEQAGPVIGAEVVEPPTERIKPAKAKHADIPQSSGNITVNPDNGHGAADEFRGSDEPPADLDGPRSERKRSGRSATDLFNAIEANLKDVEKLEALWPEIDRLPPGDEKHDLAGHWLICRFALVKRGQQDDHGRISKLAQPVWLGQQRAAKRQRLVEASRKAKATAEEK